MNAEKLLSLSLVVLAAPCLCPLASAQQGAPAAGYKLLTTISIPGNLAGGNDISWVDSATGRYYLADRGNANASPAVPPGIDVIDTVNNRYLTTITLPSGANGVVGIPRAHEVWAGLTNSTVVVINTDTNTVTHTISTGGTGRADELGYDPVDHLILIANDRDNPPFVSFISTQNYTVVKTLPFNGSAAPQSTGGLEQPVWDAATGKFYMTVPATADNANGEVEEIDPVSMTVTRSFPSTCMGPAGLGLLAGQRLIDSCGDVLDALTGRVLTTIKGVGGDEIWYNPGDQRVYFGGGTDRISINAVDALTSRSVGTFTVGQIVAAPGVSQTTHSVAADEANNEVFVPVTGVGVQVWRNGASINAIPNPIPVTGSGRYGATFITWDAPNAQMIEIHIGSPTGPLFTQNSNRGGMPTGQWVADGTTFYLQDVSNGAASASNTLASVTVLLAPAAAVFTLP